ncbi:ABC transporter substrate-binding protein [Skermanella sp. TT6]|uniref:ABC transporter substrate-binding protein n=1 Tax=Skermanella cutis TaxID=2775420 RepID=A0ABX7BEJ7_9PROT|nr:ABC transporter substrate-binding protein [Skermanella sp. TT6]QQP92180.1 ABC transporter substrate-binding protein [Skermanella sp. TT6]
MAGKTWVAAAIGMALAAFLLTAEAIRNPAASQIPDEVLVVGQIAEPKSLDPHAVTATNDFRILMNLYDGLVRFRSGTLEVEPALARSWKVSEDGRTYTFHLRDGVAFHDGTPFDAEAVKFNFDRMLDDRHPQHDTGPFPLAFFFSAVERTEAVDPLTVRFHLKEPYAPLLSNLAYPTGLLVSPAAVRAAGKEFGRQPVGTGAYRFAQWESNAKVVLERNADYWDGAPTLQAVIFRPLTDANTRLTELLAGGLDLMVEVPPDAVDLLRKAGGFTLYEQAGPHLWFLILNTREGPFKDPRARQAVNLAIDKQALVDQVLQGTATVADGIVPAAFEWAHDDTLEPYPHDPDRARQLLREAGAENAELTFLVAEGGSGMLAPIPMATAIQADLAKVGLKVNIQTYEWNTYLGLVNQGLAGRADMAQMAWMTNDPDTLPFLTLRTEALPESGGFNSGYYSNPEVDRLLVEARRSTDRNERADLYKRIQRIVREDAPWAFVANWKQNGVATDRVKGFELQPSFLLDLAHVSKSGG